VVFFDYIFFKQKKVKKKNKKIKHFEICYWIRPWEMAAAAIEERLRLIWLQSTLLLPKRVTHPPSLWWVIPGEGTGYFLSCGYHLQVKSGPEGARLFPKTYALAIV
jgi:hypothetical protein